MERHKKRLRNTGPTLTTQELGRQIDYALLELYKRVEELERIVRVIPKPAGTVAKPRTKKSS